MCNLILVNVWRINLYIMRTRFIRIMLLNNYTIESVSWFMQLKNKKLKRKPESKKKRKEGELNVALVLPFIGK